MIYLLGVDHKIQHDGIFAPKQKYTDMFVEAIEFMIDDLSIEVVVEEFNEEAKQMNHVKESVVERVCKNKCIKLIFCEPSREDRRANGILAEHEIIKQLGFNELRGLTEDQRKQVNEETLKQFPIREGLWYDTVKDDLDTNVLCVIGAAHVPTFGRLLENKGYERSVISENWCQENFG